MDRLWSLIQRKCLIAERLKGKRVAVLVANVADHARAAAGARWVDDQGIVSSPGR